MSYFSRIQLDTGHPRAREALQIIHAQDADIEHRWLWRFFPPADAARRDFLFRRMEPRGDRELPMYFVVSARLPVSPHPAWRVNTRDYDPLLREGDRLAFELRVNPVVTRGRRRHDVVMDGKTALARTAGREAWKALRSGERPAEVRDTYAYIHKRVNEWFENRGDRVGFAARNGFTMARDDDGNTRLRVDGYRRHRLPSKDRDGKSAWFTAVDVAGELTVTEPKTFRSALLHGLGHARAYGCGLMLVRRS